MKSGFLAGALSAFLALAWLLPQASLTAGEPFKFVQISDPHFGWTDSKEIMPELSAKVNALNEKIEFIAITGDFFDKGMETLDPETVKECKDFLGSFKVPVYCVPGNHDFRDGHHNTQLCAENYCRLIGPLSSVVECKGWRMVFFCELPLTRLGGPVEGYDPLKWLDEALKAPKPEPSIIFLHVPPIQNGRPKYDTTEWLPGQIEAFSALVHKYDVKAVISGHYHIDAFNWDGGIPVFCSAAATIRGGTQPSFKVFSVDEKGQISFRTQFVFPFRKGMARPGLREWN